MAFHERRSVIGPRSLSRARRPAVLRALGAISEHHVTKRGSRWRQVVERHQDREQRRIERRRPNVGVEFVRYGVLGPCDGAAAFEEFRTSGSRNRQGPGGVKKFLHGWHGRGEADLGAPAESLVVLPASGFMRKPRNTSIQYDSCRRLLCADGGLSGDGLKA